MGRVWLLVGLVGCSFTAPDAMTGGADAPTDTSARTSCHVVGASPSRVAGTVGLSTGGGVHTDLRCDPGTVIVGVAFDMSDQPVNGQNARSARGIRIACAIVTIDSGGPTSTIATTREAEGNGGASWSPSTFTFPALCTAGGVVSGLSAHGGTTSNVTNLLLDTAVTCTQLDRGGEQIGSYAIAIVDGLQGQGMNPSSVQCATGEQLVGLNANAGAGLDSLVATCAPTGCE